MFPGPGKADIAGMRVSTAWFERPHVPLAVLGTVLVWVSSIAGSGFSPISIPFALWSTLPYGVLWIAGSRLRDRWPVLGAGMAAIAADVGIRAAVFVWPRGSIAAIALVFSPAYITAIVMPAGAVAGWLLGMLWRWHLAGRAMALTLGPIALGLLALGLARPELFPTAVLARRDLLQRIGPPRVVAGGDAFVSVPVSTKAAVRAGRIDIRSPIRIDEDDTRRSDRTGNIHDSSAGTR